MARTRINPGEEEKRVTPIGLFNFAESYWLSARALKEIKVLYATHPDFPVYFLYYHAIELYLKAYLRLHGHTAAQLRGRELRHDMSAISKRAATLGLSFKPKEKVVFAYMAETDAMMRSRYLLTGFASLPPFGALERTCKAVRELVGWAIADTGMTVRRLSPRRRKASRRP